MPKQKGSVGIIILGVVFLVILGVGGFVIFNMVMKPTIISPLRAIPPVQNTSTASAIPATDYENPFSVDSANTQNEANPFAEQTDQTEEYSNPFNNL